MSKHVAGHVFAIVFALQAFVEALHLAESFLGSAAGNVVMEALPKARFPIAVIVLSFPEFEQLLERFAGGMELPVLVPESNEAEVFQRRSVRKHARFGKL